MSKQNIFFTADTHFNHRNIVSYTDRPFESVEEMDEVIISNWNAVVKKDDIVYHLGDFCFARRDQDFFKVYHSYRERLNGKILLIIGNHDKKIGAPFPHNLEGKTLLYNLNVNNKQTIVLCHYAMRVWHKSHFDSWHLFGHTHNTIRGEGKSLDVGVDGHDFYPWHFDEIEEYMSNRPHNFDYVGE